MLKKKIYLQHLRDLKEKLNLGKMSVLVGSGFSKNASHKFPNWAELLKDMVIELYPKDFITINRVKFADKRNFLIREKVDQIVNEIGYIEMVSKYVDKKGFEEAICTYIEDNIPLLERENGYIYIEHKGEREILDEGQLDLHKDLVSLSWNNIYTTNYDQLLDFCVDEHASDKLTKDISEIGEKIAKLNEQIDDEEIRIEKVNRPVGIAQHSISSPTISIGTLNEKQNIEKIERLKAQRNRYDIIRREKESQKHLTKKVITEENELALKHASNIIKLHGSIRTKADKTKSVYGFSGDLTTHYILSKEHYNSYSEKHQAFMHLMRISLLQESFCIIGFSGDDPNFKAWLVWVKNILKGKNTDETKVYFIDLNDGARISKDKMLFFENNKIAVIPLSSDEIHKEINYSGSLADKRSLLQSFLKYLGTSNGMSTVDYDSALTINYEKIWTEIETRDTTKLYDLEKLKDLTRVKAYGIVLPLNFNVRNILEGFVFSMNTSIAQLKSHKEEWYTLYAYAIEDLRIPISLALASEAKINWSIDEPTFQKAVAYDNIFSANFDTSKTNHQDGFTEIMSLAFSFQFPKLYMKAKENLASKKNIILSSGIVALTSPKEAYETLEPIVDSLDSSSQILLAKKLLFGFHRIQTWNIHKELKSEIQQMEKSDIHLILEELEEIAASAIKTKEKPAVLGKDRHKISQTFTFTNRPTNLYSVQYVYSLFKLGLQQNILGTGIISNEEWYKLHLLGYEEYPIPYLYYSLQCSDEKIVKRIGQDYAFNLNLRPKLPIILSQLLSQNNLQSEVVTNRLKSNIFIFCTKILIAIPSDDWQDNFFKHVHKNIADINRNTRTFEDYVDLIMKCLMFTTNKQYLIKALEQFLSDDSLEMVMKITYGVVSNKNITLSSRSQSRKLKELLNSLIEGLDENFEKNLFLLGNLKSLLSKSQTTKVISKINKIDFNNFRYIKILRTIVTFCSSESLKHAILNSKKLWYSGIEENSFSPDDFISLSQFRLRDKNLIKWSKEEIVEIYNKLVPELNKIIRYTDKGGNTNWGYNFLKELLNEMHNFLEAENEVLRNISSYPQILSTVKKSLLNMRNFDDISTALYADDESIVADSLRELDSLIYYGKPSDFLNEINLVNNRIILEAGSKSRVEQCLFYLETWLRRDRLYEEENVFQIAINILKKFRDKEDYQGYDLPFLYDKLTSIAITLKDNGFRNSVLDYWMEVKHSKVFNNL